MLRRKPLVLGHQGGNDHSNLVSRLDEEVSRYVRLLAASESPRPGYLQCFTCGEWVHWKKADAGHFIPRHRHGTRFDLRNIRPQCTRCNRYHEGEHWLFRSGLVQSLGELEVADLELTASRWGLNRHDNLWLLDQIDKYKKLNKPLLEEAKSWE